MTGTSRTPAYFTDETGAPIEVARKKKNQWPTPPNPQKTILEKGSVHGEDALALSCDIMFESDVAVTLRDGVVLYADIFRPPGGEDLPTVMAWTPFGKTDRGMPLPWGVDRRLLSNLQTFEGPDPAYWCRHGYAIINVDVRGNRNSRGATPAWGTQDGRDAYDVIEWVAGQSWSSGKIGMSGNSALAISQWFAAAQQPPHLAAIAPWEGFTDIYRHSICPGGIPDVEFNIFLAERAVGEEMEFMPAMLEKYPLMNAYWADKAADLEKINIPAYVVASYTNKIHTRGTLKGFYGISSQEKWLRIHNGHEWEDYYEQADDLRRFFDYALKGEDNDWRQTPRVRMSVLDPGGEDIVHRPEEEFPPAGTRYQRLYLDAAGGRMTPDPVEKEASIRYRGDDGQGKATFDITFDGDREITGHMMLRLWVEADGADDMDLFVMAEKIGADGKPLRPIVKGAPFSGFDGAPVEWGTGRLRVSQRRLDPERSSPSMPFHFHTKEKRLTAGEVVPVEIELCPMGMRWHAGQSLRVIVAGYNMERPQFEHLPPIQTRNKGHHILHTGGKYAAYLLVPVVTD
jgi:predicted acyl esterase